MKSLSATLLAVVAAVSFRSFAAPPDSGPLPPRRLVLVSFDGLGGLELRRRLAGGQLSPDGFARARREGVAADRLEVVTPSLTAVSHASLATGAPPSKTGVVSNHFRPAQTPLGTRASGFEVEPEVETLWEAARKQGKRVASLCWPGLAQRTVRTTTDVGLAFNEGREEGRFLTGPSEDLALEDARILPPDAVSFSPPRALRVPTRPRPSPAQASPGRTVVVVDPTDDGRKSYTELLVLDSAGQVEARVRAGEWFPIAERRDDGDDRDVLFGRWAKLLSLAPDLSSLSLYLGPEGRSRAWPDDFRRTLEKEAGFWPGAPDARFLLGPEPDTESFLEQTRRFARFLVRAFEAARRRGDWDLLLAYLPIVDEGAHALTVADGPPAPASAVATRLESALRDVYRAADSAAAAYMGFLPDGDVMLVSDHGMRPMRRSLNVLEALRRQGALRTRTDETGDSVVAPDSPADAVASGGIAHVYLSRAGAVPGGLLAEPDAEALLRRLATYFRSLRDEAGEEVFSRVLTRSAAASLSLDHPNAGDLVLVSRGGVSLRALLRPGDRSLFVEPENPGQHGFDPDPELDGIFFHAARDLAPEAPPLFRALDVAPRVAARLGVRFPTTRAMSDAGVPRVRVPRAPAVNDVSLVEATGLPDRLPRTRASLAASETGLLVTFECEAEPPLSIVQPRGAPAGSPVWADECVEVFLSEGSAPGTYLELVVNPAGAVYAARVVNPDSTRATWKMTPVPVPSGVRVEVSGGPGPDARAWTAWTCRVEVPWSAFESGPPSPGSERRANLYRIARGRTTSYAALSPTLRSPPDFHVPLRFARLTFPPAEERGPSAPPIR